MYFVFDNNCHYSESVTVDIFNGPCAKIFLTSNDCNNVCTGSAFFYNQGIFTPPLTYNWSNGGTDESVDGLCAGTTELTVTDALGASDVYQVEVENAVLQLPEEVYDFHGKEIERKLKSRREDLPRAINE